MAVVRGNPMLEGLSGTLGELVFRRRGGRTFVARRPRRGPSKPLTEKRRETASRFREAVAFAREARTTPAFRSLSRLLRGYSPYHLAIQDYLSLPVIERFDDSGIGPDGGVLLVEVSERIEVRSVEAHLIAGTERRTVRGERVLGARRLIGEQESAAWPGPGSGSAPVRGPAPTSGRPPAPGPSPSSSATATAGAAARPATPAELFFRRPAAPPAPIPIEPPAPQASIAASAEASTAASAEASADASAGASIAVSVDADGQSLVITTWRLRLPGPGEVEIVASDYAGNRAVLTLSVPTGGADAARR